MVATSCESVSDLDVRAGEGLVTVTYEVKAPQASRVFSDGYTARELHYSVHAVRAKDANGNADVTSLDYLPELTGTKNFDADKLSTTVEFQLTTGNMYAVIFWAAAEGKTKVVDAEKAANEIAGTEPHYTIDLPAKTMTVDYTKTVYSSDETRDAFYKFEIIDVTGKLTKTVELKRPFAQLNIGTNDYLAAEHAGYVFTHGKIEVPAYQTLDFVSGKTSNQTTATVFDYAAAPKNETFPVAGYEYLSMNYLLMNVDEEVVTVKFSYATDQNGADAKTREVGAVPLKRNHRTNLFGQLFTSNVNFNVIIIPGYDDPAYNGVGTPVDPEDYTQGSNWTAQ